MLKKWMIVVALVVTGVALAGCGSDSSDPPAATTTAANGDVFNAADVSFATNMIPHHAQALQMVDLTVGRTLDPDLAGLTGDIRDAQAPEIEVMTGWLTAWGKPIPETARDHVNADDDAMDGMSMSGDEMPGMMSDDELAELDAATDAEFGDMWLTMMIAHHQGAIDMARAEQADGVFPPAIRLAQSIETSQQQEIDHMRRLLES